MGGEGNWRGGATVKQISARAFRVAFPRLTEPVTVSTRGEGGIIRILGTWTPTAVEGAWAFGDYEAMARAGTKPPLVPLDLGQQLLATPRPVPKPSKHKAR